MHSSARKDSAVCVINDLFFKKTSAGTYSVQAFLQLKFKLFIFKCLKCFFSAVCNIYSITFNNIPSPEELKCYANFIILKPSVLPQIIPI